MSRLALYSSVASVFALIAFSAATTTPAAATTIVAPNSLAAAEGDSNINVPWTRPETVRWQQVYSATAFAAFGEPHFITQIAFRQDGGSDPITFTRTISDIQIDLSTTSAAPDPLAPIFAENVGADNMTVYSGSLTISSSGMPPPGPKDFDILISLQSPFFYDPSKGNLLLDVRKFVGSGPLVQFDMENEMGDSISMAYSFDVNAAAASNVHTRGLVTQFTAVPVPEPSTALLVIAGLGVLGSWERIGRPKAEVSRRR